MIIIQLEPNEILLIEEIKNIPESDTELILKKNFNGQQELVEMLVKITVISLPLIANIIVQAIKSKKQIVVKHKGTTIKGLSEANTMKILEKLIDKK